MARFTVNAGPSKFDLMLAIFHTDPVARHLTFKGTYDTDTLDLEVLLLGIQREDGSGESWALFGSAMVTDGVWKRFRGYYTTTRRTGALLLED